jgi:hypothetical protein
MFTCHTFYRAIGQRKVGSEGEGGSGSGTSMTLVTGDGNREEGKEAR